MGSLSINQLDYLRIGANGPNPLLVPEGQKYNSGTVCSGGCKPCQCCLVLDQLYGDLLSSFNTVASGLLLLVPVSQIPSIAAAIAYSTARHVGVMGGKGALTRKVHILEHSSRTCAKQQIHLLN